MNAYRLIYSAIVVFGLAACASPGKPTQPQKIGLGEITYEVLKRGSQSDEHPNKKTDTITVNYEVSLSDGKIVDSSYKRGKPSDFELGKLIPAWQVVLPLMSPGDSWLVTVPPAYAYGSKERGDIPANSLLTFKIELISFKPTPPKSGS